MLITLRDAAESSGTDVSYLYKLLKANELKEYRVRIKGQIHKAIDDQDPRWLELLKQKIPFLPELPRSQYNIDWEEFCGMLLRGEVITDKPCTPRSAKNIVVVAQSYLKRHKGVSKDELRAALMVYEKQMQPDNDKFSSRYALWLAVRTLARYLVLTEQLPADLPEKLVSLRPRQTVTDLERVKYKPESIDTVLTAFDNAVSRRGNKVYSDYDRALNKALLLTAFHTGARAAEICGVRLKDVDLDSRLIRYFGKGGKARRSGMPQALQDALRVYLGLRPSGKLDEKLFLSETGTELTPAYFHRRMKRVGQWAGIERLNPHGLRRTAITHMLNDLKLSVPQVQKLVGHSDMKTTSKYADTAEEDAIRALNQF